ncbi:MAG: lipocalin family protein [Opitutales bacterium]|nr:lipocalin family protein [Opitutales bacterium]
MTTMRCCIVVVAVFLSACVRLPENVTPVEPFVLQRYLGTWYEIARLDHSFERGLDSVTATYSLRDDGDVRVLNRGYSAKDKAWEDAEGRARFVESPDKGFLKVSFFGPFYGSYVIMELDQEHYRYALVCGPNTSYLWILSRTPELEQAIVERLISKAQALGFDTDQLIFVEHRSALAAD